jgi:hypothetical protein
MESAGLGWAAEIGKQGLGYLLFMGSLVVLWLKDKELRDCQKQSREDAMKMAVSLELAAKSIGESNGVMDETKEATKLFAGVLQQHGKQLDISDDRAKERAGEIVRALDRQRGAVNG